MILIFQPIPKPAVNDLPLVANLTEIEKVRPFFLQVSEEEKAAHPTRSRRSSVKRARNR